MKGEMKDPRQEFGKAVMEFAEADERIVIISADSGKSSGFGAFIEKYPERYVECGIMEQSAVGIASGLATTGKIPVFCAIAPFVTARPFEMFRNDIGYMKQNAKIIGRNCGITYSELGATHHSLDDFALMRMIPGVTILAPQDPGEIRMAVKAMLKHQGPVYMRIGNPKIPELFEERQFEIGKGRILKEGTNVTLISTGSMTKAALEAAIIIEQQGVSCQVIGMPTVCPLDEELIIEAARKTGRLVIVEEHYVDGGLGTMVSEVCANKYQIPVKRLGVPKSYATSGPYDELLSYYGLDARGIADAVIQSVKECE